MQEQSIFIEAVEKADAAERAAFLDRACAGDASLRQRIERLIARYEHAQGFLEGTPVARDATVNHQPTIREGPGTAIGPFKLLQQIGEGGMGVVFMAEQTAPVRRIAALKIIKPGMDTRRVIARFEAERQALAMMDHPNIAKVLDAGTTDSGRPYFVMELVKGVPITKYCDERHLPVRERLELFTSVCHAVHHAHQKGIIHRDIKPTNVLVTEYDNHAVAKVIDFGVAKATAQKLTDRTMFTEFGQLVGTLEYMSPEQAKLNQLDIDTRSDIYSLGVLLYELLAGTTPFEQARLRDAALDEVLRIIREEEPLKPSTKLSSSDSLPSIAANRNTEPGKLSRQVRGELDWIVMKALEKDRNRRYGAANDLASDVERFMTDKPVEACPPSHAYRLRKFARRNKGLLVTMSTVVAVLVLASVVSTWQAIRASQAERRAKASESRARASQRTAIQERDGKERARREAVASAASARAAAAAEAAQHRRAEEVTSFLVQAFQSPDPMRDGRSITIAEVLDRAATQLEEQFADDPLTKASLLETIGDSYTGLGLFRETIPLLEQARRLRAAVKTNSLDELASLRRLAVAYENAGRLQDSVRLSEETLQRAESELGREHEFTLIAMGNLAAVYKSAGRLQEALQVSEAARDLTKSTLGPDHHETLRAINTLATVYDDSGRLNEAIPLYAECLELTKSAFGPEHPSVLTALNNLGLAYEQAGRMTEALPLLEQALQLRTSELGEEHPATLSSMNNLAIAYEDAGRVSDALPLLEKALAHCKTKLGLEHNQTLTAMNNLATAYMKSGQLQKALALLEQNLTIAKSTLGVEHPHTLVSMVNLAAAYRDVGRLNEALPLSEEASRLTEATLGATHLYTVLALSNLASVYSAADRPAEAAPLHEEALRRFKVTLGEEHVHTLGEKNELALAFAAVAKRLDPVSQSDEAVAKFRRALELLPASKDAWVDRGGVALAAAQSDTVYQKLSQLRPRDRTLRVARLHYLASLRKWDELIAVAEQLIEFDPSDHYAWYNLAPVYLYLGDATSYRRICRELLARFGDTDDPVVAERVAKTCFLAADDLAELKRARKLAEQAVISGDKHPYVNWFYLAQAMGDYRAGDFESAIRSARRSREHANQWHLLDSNSLLIEAFAHRGLGRDAEARQALSDVHRLIDNKPNLADGNMGADWPDGLRLQILLREADELFELGGDSALPEQPFEAATHRNE